MKPASLHPDPRYFEALGRLLAKVQDALPARPVKPVAIYIAGGAALHLYTGARYSIDVDARIDLPRVALPADLSVVYEGPDGLPATLYYDTQYSESFALLHEDVQRDSMPIRVPGVNPRRLDVRPFSPLDLAVSKLARFELHDQEDIVTLARSDLIDAASLRRRATEALAGYVGNVDRLRNTIDIACRRIEGLVKKQNGN